MTLAQSHDGVCTVFWWDYFLIHSSQVWVWCPIHLYMMGFGKEGSCKCSYVFVMFHGLPTTITIQNSLGPFWFLLPSPSVLPLRLQLEWVIVSGHTTENVFGRELHDDGYRNLFANPSIAKVIPTNMYNNPRCFPSQPSRTMPRLCLKRAASATIGQIRLFAQGSMWGKRGKHVESKEKIRIIGIILNSLFG